MIKKNNFEKLIEKGEMLDPKLFFQSVDNSLLIEIYDNSETVTCKVICRIKGGFRVSLLGEKAFLPGSQIDINPVSNFDNYIDMELEVKIINVDSGIVVSRKALLEEEQHSIQNKLLEEIEIGMVLEGKVKNIVDFGVFIDLGGIDGLLHITDITYGNLKHPSEVLEENQTIHVIVIDLDIEKKRVSLGMKQLKPHPWETVEKKFIVGSIIDGPIVSMTNYGVFIEIEPGVEGLVHVSEMLWTQKVKPPSELYTMGEEIKAKVLSIDTEKQEISLGVKQLIPDPWNEVEEKFSVDSIYSGVVRNLTQFGAFIELEEGIDGLLHVSDMSWTKNVKKPKDMFEKGQEIDVCILEVSKEDRKISLGYKQLLNDPWPTIKKNYIQGKIVVGEMLILTGKGIVFDLGNDLEGIIPLKNISKIEKEKINNSYLPGEKYELIVIEVDIEQKKVILLEKDTVEQ